MGIVRFTIADRTMVGDSHDFAKRHGSNDPAPLFRPDTFQLAWRKYALANLRGSVIGEMEDARSQSAVVESLPRRAAS